MWFRWDVLPFLLCHVPLLPFKHQDFYGEADAILAKGPVTSIVVLVYPPATFLQRQSINFVDLLPQDSRSQEANEKTPDRLWLGERTSLESIGDGRHLMSRKIYTLNHPDSYGASGSLRLGPSTWSTFLPSLHISLILEVILSPYTFASSAMLRLLVITVGLNWSCRSPRI